MDTYRSLKNQKVQQALRMDESRSRLSQLSSCGPLVAPEGSHRQPSYLGFIELVASGAQAQGRTSSTHQPKQVHQEATTSSQRRTGQRHLSQTSFKPTADALTQVAQVEADLPRDLIETMMRDDAAVRHAG